jgi:hypothetical protein
VLCYFDTVVKSPGTMLSYAAARRAACSAALLRQSSRATSVVQQPTSSSSSANSSSASRSSPRHFSSFDGRGGGGRGGGGGGGRGGRNDRGGRGYGQGGRGDQGGQRGGGPNSRKENFDKRVLQPAARGELGKNHESGIPRLAARKGKANLGAQSSEGQGPRFFFREEEDAAFDEVEGGGGGKPTRNKMFETLTPGPGYDNGGGGKGNDGLGGFGKLEDLWGDDEEDDYNAPDLIDDDKYYWREEEYDEFNVEGMDEELEGGEFIDLDFEESDVMGVKGGGIEFDDDDDAPLVNRGPDIRQRGGGQMGRKAAWEKNDPEEDFFFNQNDILEIAAEDDFKEATSQPSDLVLPLINLGPNVDDFLQAMVEHPSKYAQVEKRNAHPESRREPKPDFLKTRAQPTEGFITKYPRFLYVTGLSPLMVNGETGDLDNPVHRSFLQKTIARLVGVDSERVSPANTTSGFVGFESPKALAAALAAGPSETVVKGAVEVSKFRPTEDDCDFAKTSPELIVQIDNLPPGNTSKSLALSLFPEGTEVGTVYSGLTPDDIHFLTANAVLVRFSSLEQAESAVDSLLIRDRLEELAQFSVRFFRARRELVHAGFGGPARGWEVRKMGPRLVVDGDMPSRKFYLQHSRVASLRDLDPGLTKEDIAAAFQPYCVQQRDTQGSVEFATCSAGKPSGRAYVGFDIPGEAEHAIKSLNGRIELGGRKAVMKLVGDRSIPGQPVPRPEKRPERSVEELLEDLNNWERYVEPADLEELEAIGISKIVIDEALRGIRYSNPTFGAFDASLRSESLEPEKMTGQQYKELVQMYVATLKECVATPDNVGRLFQGMHFPGEPIDMEIFDAEVERQKGIKEQRSVS